MVDDAVRRADRSDDTEHARLILETANDAYVSIDEEGVILDWNRAAERMLGWSSVEAIGQTLVTLIVPEDWQEAHRVGFDRYLKTGRGRVLFRTIELPTLRRDGTRFPAEVTIWPSHADGGRRFNAFLRDATHATRLREHLQLLQRVTAAANAATSVRTAATTALEEVCQLTGWPIGHVYLRGWDEDRLRPSGWWSQGSEPYADLRAVTGQTVFDGFSGLPGRVARSAEAVWVTDLEVDASMVRVETAQQAGLRCGFAFPVLSQDRVVAVLEFFSPEPEPPSEELRDLMANIGVQLGRVFERLRWREETERADQQSEVARQLRELEAMKNTFLTAISHELRTPLTVISGVAQLLSARGAELDADQRQVLTTRLAANADRLERLLLDLLDLERLTGGRAQVARRHIDATSVVRGVIANEERDGCQVVLRGPAVYAEVDPMLLERIVDNLLGNAAKHTPAGTTVDVQLESISGRGLRLVVEDDGPGIAPEERERVLEPFTRLPTDEHTPGTGVGLSLVDRFARLHGGTVEITDSPRGGARFVVVLPGHPRP